MNQITSYSWNGKSPCTVLRSANVSLLLDCSIDVTALNAFMPQLYTETGRFKSTPTEGKQFGLPYLRQVHSSTFVDATPEVHPVPLDFLCMDSIDCILVSNLHSLLALPFYVVDTGFRGQVFATQPIFQFGRILMEEWIEYFERHSRGEADDKWKQFSVCGKFVNAPARNPLQWKRFYSKEEMERALSLVTTISFRQQTSILGGVSFTAHPSGYTIGSANWMINIEGDLIAYLSSASNKAMHARPAEWDGLVNADFCILTSLSLTSESPEYSLLNLCSTTVDTLRAGGNVLIPISPVGIVYDLIEVLIDKIDKTQGLSADPPCVYFISPAAKSSIAFANINAEYLRDMRQANVYLPDEPFHHTNLIKSGRLKIFSSVCDDFSKEYKRPCVILAGHPSLRMGDAVQLLEMWSQDVQNSLIVIDPDYPLNEIFGPFQGQGNIRPYYFPIETRLDYNDAVKTLEQLKPKALYLHDSFTRVPDVMPNQAPVVDLTIQYPNYTPLHYNEPFPVSTKRNKKRKVAVNPEVLKRLLPSTQSLNTEQAIGTIQAYFDCYDDRYELVPIPKKIRSQQKDAQAKPADIQPRCTGLLQPERLVQALNKKRIRVSVHREKDATLLQVNEWDAAINIYSDGKKTNVRGPKEKRDILLGIVKEQLQELMAA